MQYETVIGLEVHVQLATHSKLFSGASVAFGATPNSQACGVDIALPGTLPVLNQQAVVMAAKFGLAIGAEINRQSVFARKNYFYPDLPKGYQISQMDEPVVKHGSLTISLDSDKQTTNKETKVVGITRAHLEEDAGKSLHQDFHDMTAIDLNRAGTPLLEIVSEPDLRSAKEAVAYLKKLHSIICYLGISDGNMAEGSMRCDANVSVRPKGQKTLGTRTEIKNVNSFRFVEKAINYEVERHIDVLNNGGKIVQETRLYDAANHLTKSMRSKEEANDYRYFPDPDLVPVVINQKFIDEIAGQLPELPDIKKVRFIRDYALKAEDAEQLVADHDLAAYFEAVVREITNQTKSTKTSVQLAANWILVELGARLNKANLAVKDSRVKSQQFARLIARIVDNTISGKIAKTVFDALWQDGSQDGSDVDQIIEQKGLKQVTDTNLIADKVAEAIAEHPQQVAQYRAANEDKKPRLLGFFVGQVMKKTRGKANPQQVNQLLLKALH